MMHRDIQREMSCYQGHNLDNELNNFIKVWSSVVLSLSYCYFSLNIIPKGLPRLLSYTPIITLFLFLPLNLHSMHLGGTSAFFIAWLANFKLLLLVFDKGPLSDSSLSLSKFIAIACFPIRIQEDGTVANKGHKSMWNYGVKGLVVAVFVKIFGYVDRIHPNIMLIVYSFHIYFMLELMLALVAFVSRAALNVELEPQFEEPFLSTSLQDFWGRRWNIMVSRTLRPTVYNPTFELMAPKLGSKWAQLWAVFNTFVVSALMHELIFYYLGRTWPTWKITWFFMLHAVSLMIEIGVKKVLKNEKYKKYRLPVNISWLFTVIYVMGSGMWLFLPELLKVKGDIRAFDEYARVGAFVRQLVGGVNGKIKELNVTRV